MRGFVAALVAAVAVGGLALDGGSATAAPGNTAALAAQAQQAPGSSRGVGVGGAGPGGDFGHTVPFTLPPGRDGEAPSLGLTYSSSGGVRGGIAAGWDLPLPAITVDPEASTLHPEWPDGGNPNLAPRNFRGLGGGVLVPDPSLPVSQGGKGFREVGDQSFRRYEYLGGVASATSYWKVLTSDGAVTAFGAKGQHLYGWAPIVSRTDADGHVLRYQYAITGRDGAAPAPAHPQDAVLTAIQYLAPGQTQPYAQVLLSWLAPVRCGSGSLPVGSSLDYRLGYGRLSGTRKLTSIMTQARPSVTAGFKTARQYVLGYSAATESCASGDVTPFRQLDSVSETAYSADPSVPSVSLPPVKFTYGKAASYVSPSHYHTPVTLQNLEQDRSVATNAGATAFSDSAQFRTTGNKFGAVPGNGSSGGSPQNVGTLSWMLSQAQAEGESVTRMLVDVTGDGLPDLLRTRPPELATRTNNPPTGGCQVEVLVNKGEAGFEADPSVFGNFSLTEAMADLPVATPDPDGTGELICSLTRSFSSTNAGWYANPSLPCSLERYENEGEVVRGLPWGAPESWGSMQQVRHGFFDMTGDGRPDVVSQAISSVHCPYDSTKGIPRAGGSSDDPYWEVEYASNGTHGTPVRVLTKRQRRWWVYANTGTGFAQEPQMVITPSVGDGTGGTTQAHVPQDTVLTQFASSSVHGSQGSVQDVTGDGVPDWAVKDLGSNTGKVFTGKPAGLYDPVTLGSADVELGSKTVKVPIDDFFNPWKVEGYTDYGVGLDINGDGLRDRHEWSADDTGSLVKYNTGAGFGNSTNGGQQKYSSNHLPTMQLRWFRMNALEVDYDFQPYHVRADYYNKSHMADIDYDGLPDFLSFDDETGASDVYLTSGTEWTRRVDGSHDIVRALAGWVHVGGLADSYADRGDYKVAYQHRAVDLNGDGLLDLVDTQADGSVKVRHARSVLDTTVNHNAPARLLRTITNNSGAKTTVTYARDSAARKWVVSKLELAPGLGEPAITTEYAYRGLTTTPDHYGVHRVRGYAEVRAFRPGRAATTDDLTTISVTAYDQNHRGVPVRTVQVQGRAAFDDAGRFDAATRTGVMAVTDHTYHVHELGLRAPGMLATSPSRTVLPRTTTSYTCAGTGQTAAACTTTAQPMVTEITWTGLRGGSTLVAMVPSRTEARFTNGQGKAEARRTDTLFNTYASASRLVLAPQEVTKTGVVDGVTQPLGQHDYTYEDDQYLRVRTVATTDQTQEADTVSLTHYTYHPAGSPSVGLVRRVWAPEQVARYGLGDTAAGYTEYTYDEVGVHVTSVRNPVGHVTTQTVDMGTGAVVATAGPDYVCWDGSDPGTEPDPADKCQFSAALYRERVEIRADGLGRPLEVKRFPASNQPGAVVARNTYNDRAYYNSGGANPVTTTSEVAVGDGEWSHTHVRYDGIGRSIKETVQRDPNPSASVEYDYDQNGALQVTRSQRANGAAGWVATRTDYDALGRPVALHEIEPQPRLLSSTSYDGLTVTHTRETGAPVARTIHTSDPAGQLVRAQELADDLPGGADVYAATTYRYDVMGNTEAVTDPDGAVTTMTHDFHGQRRSSTTAGRTWSYDYDFNGNLTGVTEPIPATGGTEAQYTHAVTFDDANRPTTQTPAVRDLDAAAQAELAIGQKRFVYDRPDAALCAELVARTPAVGCDALQRHQVGRLSMTHSPVATVINKYNAYGDLASTRQTVDALSGIVVSEPIEAAAVHDPSGTVESVSHRAYLGTSTTGALVWEGVTVDTEYDRDGTPGQLSANIGGKDMTIRNVRNSAGQVTTRNINVNATAGFARPTMTRSYDEYGRPTEIKAMMGSVQRYAQTYDYDDTGDIAFTEEQLGNTAQPRITTEYRYDNRGQLTSAEQDGGVGYTGVFEHTIGGRMAVSSINTVPDLPRVPRRNVTHRYQDPTTGGDPQRLDALDRSDGTPLTSYTYDAAGNTDTRTLPDGSVVRQTWDGPNLRKVALPNGEKELHFYDGAARVATARYSASGALVEARRWFGQVEVSHSPSTGPQYRQTLDLGGEAVARVDGDRNVATFEHYLTTPQGHQVLALDAAGSGTTSGAATRRVASYGPFGELLTQAVAENTPPGKYQQEFNGKHYDALSGLHYYGFRFYDSLALQWASSDPLFRSEPDLDAGNPRSANLYTFTNNDPVGQADLTGLCPECSTNPGDWGWELPELGDPLSDMMLQAEATQQSFDQGWRPAHMAEDAIAMPQPLAPGELPGPLHADYGVVFEIVDAIEREQMIRGESVGSIRATPKVRTKLGAGRGGHGGGHGSGSGSGKGGGKGGGNARPLNLGMDMDVARAMDLQEAGKRIGLGVGKDMFHTKMRPSQGRRTIAGAVSNMDLDYYEKAVVVAEANRFAFSDRQMRPHTSLGILEVGQYLIVPARSGVSAPVWAVFPNGQVYAGRADVRASADQRSYNISNIVLSRQRR